jgi:hypothetical protein
VLRKIVFFFGLFLFSGLFSGEAIADSTITIRLNSSFYNMMVEVSEDKLKVLESSLNKNDRKFAHFIRTLQKLRDYDRSGLGPLVSDRYFKIDLKSYEIQEIGLSETEKSYLLREKDRFYSFVVGLGVDSYLIYSDTALDAVSVIQTLYEGNMTDIKDDVSHLADEWISALKSTRSIGASVISLSPTGVVQGVWNLGTSVVSGTLDAAFWLLSTPMHGIRLLFRLNRHPEDLQEKLLNWIIGRKKGGGKRGPNSEEKSYGIELNIGRTKSFGTISFVKDSNSFLTANLALNGREIKNFQWFGAYIEELSEDNLFFAQYEENGTAFSWVGQCIMIDGKKEPKIEGKILDRRLPLPDPTDENPLLQWRVRIRVAYPRLMEDRGIGSFAID